MKMRRVLSGLLFGLGCATTFVGFLALVLPSIENEQLKLVLASFEATSRFGLVNAINRFMRFAFRQSWELLGVGVLGVAVGAWLFNRFTQPEETAPAAPNPYQRPEAEPQPEPEEHVLPEAPNPFAVYHPDPEAAIPSFAPKAVREPEANPFAAYHRPILEENPIEPEPVRIPPTFAEESRAIASSLGDESPSGSRMILRTPQPLEEAPEPAPLAPPAAEEEPPKQPVPTAPATSRIRSTMGWHKQW